MVSGRLSPGSLVLHIIRITSIPPLSSLYRGPYKVLFRLDEFFIILIGDKQEWMCLVGPSLPQRGGTVRQIYSRNSARLVS